MEALILWLLSSVLAAAIVAYLRLLLAGRSPEPSWLVPLVLLIIGIILAFGLGISVYAIAGIVGQLVSALMIAFGGWMLLRRFF